MKTISLYLSIAVLGIGLLSSCAKKTASPTNTTTNNVTSSTMTASVGGTSWAASTVTGISNYGIAEIAGVRSSDGSGISIILAVATPGSYTIDGISNSLSYIKSASADYTATSGTIVVTANANGSISGTFSGSAVNTSNSSDMVNITNGAFTCKF